MVVRGKGTILIWKLRTQYSKPMGEPRLFDNAVTPVSAVERYLGRARFLEGFAHVITGRRGSKEIQASSTRQTGK